MKTFLEEPNFTQAKFFLCMPKYSQENSGSSLKILISTVYRYSFPYLIYHIYIIYYDKLITGSPGSHDFWLKINVEMKNLSSNFVRF